MDNANFRCKHFRNSSELQNRIFNKAISTQSSDNASSEIFAQIRFISRGNRFITSEESNYSSARKSTGIYIHNFLGSEELNRTAPNIKPETLEQFYGNISFQYGDFSNSSKFTADRRLSGQCWSEICIPIRHQYRK